MTKADEEESICGVRSIGSGEIKRQPSWSDINSLIDRIETLEQERGDEAVPLVTPSDAVDIYDCKENNGVCTEPPTLDRRASSRRGMLRLMLGSRRGSFQTDVEEVEQKYDEFEFPESTYTFLITEPIISTPCGVGCVAYGISLACLVLALRNELDNGTDDNPYDIAEVTMNVRAVQFLGIIIGVLMDDEIPTGLELIGKALEQRKDSDKYFSTWRIFLSSLLRISIGAMFLTCLFFVVIQESNVLDIFFDVLALEFVESIDDVIFELCRRGFFSRRLKIAANKSHAIKCISSSTGRRIRKWSNRVIRGVYAAVMIGMCVGLSYITIQQPSGEYGCTSIVVTFGDEVFENAWIALDNECKIDSDCSNQNQRCFQGFCHERRLLIFSHFNGLYVMDATVAERPRYVEMNKEKGDPFKNTIPAEIHYCEDIESWVFTHPNIKTTLDSEDSNECQWLLRSEQTEDFDLVELSTDFWRLWNGRIVDDYRIDIDCAECSNDSDCNYMGTCVDEPGLDQKCECFDGRFGIFCQFETPCDVIRSEKDVNTTLEIVRDFDQDGDSIDFVQVYGRPMYSARMQGKPYGLMRDGYWPPDQGEKYFTVEYPVNASTVVAPHKHNNPDGYEDDDFFEIANQTVAFQQLMKNYTFVLRYTGSRWYGQIVDPNNLSSKSFQEEEYHAFWMNSFSGVGQEDNATLIVSEKTTDTAYPAGIDFFEMRRRNKIFEGGEHDYDYGPFGVLLPLVALEGAGFFHCNKPSE